MKSRLFKKFFFTTAIIVTVCLTVTLTILSFVISNYFSREKYELLSSNCQSVSEIALFDINSSNLLIYDGSIITECPFMRHDYTYQKVITIDDDGNMCNDDGFYIEKTYSVVLGSQPKTED